MKKYYITTSLITIISLLLISCAPKPDENKIDIALEKQKVLDQIIQPEFKDTTFNIVDAGAAIDGKTDVLPIINEQIIICSNSGGGIVHIPDGKFFIKGSIVLHDNVNLNLADNAELLFSTEPDDYLPMIKTRWEGVDCYNYSALIYAQGKKNIAITGKGLLNGQGANDNWWSWKGRAEYEWEEGMPSQNAARNKLMQQNIDEVDIEERKYGPGHYLRPNFIQLYECENILLEDFTVKDSPMWIVHPVFSINITIRGMKSVGSGPNNDGCDPESCKNVLIENCYFDNGDDCIAIKSGRNADGRKKGIPSENIIIRNCKMKDGHGGVVIGSEISGGCKNVFVENCEMDSPNLDRAIRIKTNSFRGGTIENLFVDNITVGEVKDAVLRINMFYDPKEGTGGKYPPTVKNIYLKNITSSKSNYGLRLEGIENSKIEGVFIDSCEFNGVKSGNKIENVNNLSVNNTTLNGNVLNVSK